MADHKNGTVHVRDQAIEHEQTRYALTGGKAYLKLSGGGAKYIWSWGEGGKANMKASASLDRIDRRWDRIYFHMPPNDS